MANVTPTGKKRIRRSKVWKYMIEECADNGRRSAICNWQHCGKKMSISYNGGTTNLIDHLVATHAFQRTPLKPPKEECSDSGSSSHESYKETELKKERKYREKEQTEVFLRNGSNGFEYWSPVNIYTLPDPYVTYASVRDVHNNNFFRTYSKVEMKGSEKWIILCLATVNSELSPLPIKRDKDSDEAIAFIMNMDTKSIKKEYLSQLKYIKGTISADLKREVNIAIDGLPDWIIKNDGKKRKQLDNSNGGNSVKKDPFDAQESSSGGEAEATTKLFPGEEENRFPSPTERKRLKKSQSNIKNGSGSDSNRNSPVYSPTKIPPFSTPVPSLHLTSQSLSNFNRMKLIVDEKYNKPPLLLKKREITIAPPEPPQPLDNPRDD